MNKHKILALAIIVITGCQDNSLRPAFDCNLTDMAITAMISNTECGLATGSIEISVSGGEQPYRYSLNEETPQDSPAFGGLNAGQYTLSVTDNLGCSAEYVALVSNVNGLSVSVTTANSDCTSPNGRIIVTASNGVEPYEYQLAGGIPQDSAEFIVGPGIHEIMVTDAIGCTFLLTQQIQSNTSYATDIQPIIMTTCAVFGCHDGSNSSLPNFTNLVVLQANASQVKSRTQSGNMPRSGSLTQNQIDLIACWVDDGAQNN
jgi:SprB-like repeat protein